MTTPRTEAGRRLTDLTDHWDRGTIEISAAMLRDFVVVIEDEAARMERERIAAAVRTMRWPDSIAYGTEGEAAAFVRYSAVLAAITDTGEEAAP